MENKRLYMDIHILQNVPPSCINRDDTGSPKTAIYGGVTRARVSSQAWKRAVRMYFKNEMGLERMGERTKRIIPMVAGEIARLDPMADAADLARQVLEVADIGIKGRSGKKDADKEDQEGTGALFFLSRDQAEALARYALDTPVKSWKPDALKKLLAERPSVDMVLFGRMVASDPSLNVDAACQVAHSLSTHAVRNEFDYFTAVDDRSPEDNAGAGHIGTVEFNASVLYRYATVNLPELTRVLGKADAVDAARDFAEAFICAMPTGKQNTFANRTLPDVVYVALRTDQPLNLVGAFEKPVRAQDGGLLAPSVRALSDYAHGLCAKYDMSPAAELDLGGEITGKPAGGLKAMLAALAEQLDQMGGVD
ncbi:MAG: type I-E CRISPR-associated protein Cas7/Cse4/CasC [Clostridia bacterium]|nr:type I-E CRISPR-associated protein Cas7/Cse4/CasC [Clostridia bacterium]